MRSLLALLAACLALPPAHASGEGDAAQGRPAALSLRGLDGEPRSLESLRGRIVVLNFWATWCIPCREEMPILVKARDRYASRGVEVIAASADDEDDLGKVEAFREEQGLTFPVWVGATIPDMTALGLGEALPATAILDREGRVAFRILGPVTRAQLTDRLDFLLGDGATEAPPRDLDTFAAHADAGDSRSSEEPDRRDTAKEEPHGGISERGRREGTENREGDDAGVRDGEHSTGEDEAAHDHDHGEGEGHDHGGGGDDASLVPS